MLEQSGVKICNAVSYISEMPVVFKSSKINLSPTLRANRTGIPLRAVDVLGTASFLLTTHRAEIDDYFNRDEIVYYENIEDAIELTKYYLSHDEEKLKIAGNGFERVKSDFSYPDRIQKMLATL